MNQIRNIHDIEQLLQSLVSQRAWGVSLGVGSFITFEFGKALPPNRPGGKIHGEWHLWVYGCTWEVRRDGNLIASSEDPRPKMEEGVIQLEGKTLNRVDFDPRTSATTFTFEGGYAVHLLPASTADMDDWMLFTPSGQALSLGPGRNWSYDQISG